jgi:CRP-like cAMP-binding protein
MAIVTILRSCELFRGFSDAGLSMIEKIVRERNIPAGTPIFVENMVSDSMFIIRLGIVRLSIRSDSGQEHILEKLTTPEVFGELSLLIGGQRMVTTTAETNCELIEIPRRDFLQLQKQKPQACLKLLINIVKRFGNTMQNCREHIKPLLLSQLID